MNKSQFNHLAIMIESDVEVDGKVSISKTTENVATAKEESCIYKYFSQSP